MKTSLLADFKPDLVIFDKDGTLIDYHAMWGGWLQDLAASLQAESGVPVTPILFREFGYHGVGTLTRADGLMAVTPMATLRRVAGAALREAGCDEDRIEPCLAASWRVPDPVELAHPLTDLLALFASLRAGGARLAIATGDDREPTLVTLNHLGVAHLIDDLSCGDDGLPAKPAPDSMLTLCRSLGVLPNRTAVIGDTVADLQMGRAAGAGLVLGVASGVSALADLSPWADHVLASIADLH